MPTETESVAGNEQVMSVEPAKPKRRKPARRKAVKAPVAETNDVRVKAEFSLPVEQFGRLTSGQEEFDAEFDDEETEETEEADPNYDRNLLFRNGLEPVPFRSAMDDDSRSESVRHHLRQISEANAFKAKIWRVPESFAARNPLIQRKPTSTPGWAFQGEIAYDPDALDSDLLTLFSDGYYFVEIRERGLFRSGMLKTIGNPHARQSEAQSVPPQVVIHEPAPTVDPLRDATAQAKVMNSVVEAATKLLAAHPAQPKQPSLKDRLEELQMLRQMFAPPQPAQPQRDPMERLAETLESEAMKRIIGAIKSENPVESPQESSGFWDFAMNTVEQLAPGLNPLLAGLGRMLMNSGLPAATAPIEQPPRAVAAPAAISTDLPVEEITTPTTDTTTEEDGVDIRFLLEDLANNVAPEITAQKIRDLMANKPLIKPFLKKYLSSPNQTIWDDVIGLADSETEAANLRQALEACAWREEWLNSLKQSLQ